MQVPQPARYLTWPKPERPTLAAASLELKAVKCAHSGDVNSVAFSPDGKTIVSGSDDKTLKVWDSGVLALTPSEPLTQISLLLCLRQHPWS